MAEVMAEVTKTPLLKRIEQLEAALEKQTRINDKLLGLLSETRERLISLEDAVDDKPKIPSLILPERMVS